MVPILGTCISGGEAVYEGCKGNGTQALVKVGETLVSGVADVFTISTFGGSTLFTTSLTSFGKVGTTIASKKIVERAVITGGCLVAKHHLIQHNSYGVSDSSGDSYAHKEAARSQSPREKKLSNSGRKNSSAGVGGAGVGSAGGGGERPHNSNLKSSHEQDSIASEFLLCECISDTVAFTVSCNEKLIFLFRLFSEFKSAEKVRGTNGATGTRSGRTGVNKQTINEG